MLEKTKKLFVSRARTEADLKRYHQKVEKARSCRVEKLVTSCTKTMSKLVRKHELLLDHSKKTENREVVTLELETWIKEVTVTNDRVLGTARDYIDQCPPTESASQVSRTTTNQKTASSRQTTTSSQKALLIAQQRREEVERQNAAALRLAEQKQEFELEALQQQQEALRLEAERLKKQQALCVAE